VTVAPQCQQFSGYKRLLALLMELKLVAQNISKRYIQYLSESQTCCQSKIDIKNDFKDIRANIIRKGACKYRALKVLVFLRGIFTILNFFFKTKKCLYNSFFIKG
jgi:hypothetical protein